MTWWLQILSDNTWKGTLVLLAACAIVIILRRASAAVRHLVWTSALASLLVLPALALLLPAWHAPLPAPNVTALPVVPKTVVLSQTASVAPPVAPHPSGHPEIFIIWAAGVVAVLARLSLGSGRAIWIGHRAKPVETSEWTKLLSEIAARMRVRIPVSLLQMDRPAMPMTWGLLRRVILLPANAQEWSYERRSLVLSHELAHVRRRDCFFQLMSQIVCALYWFHPLVWLAAAQLRKERERACDDEVLGMGAQPSQYAGHLVDLACSLHSGNEQWSMALAMARPSDLESRLAALLDRRRNRRGLTKRSTAFAAVAAAGLLLPLGALRAPAQSNTSRVFGVVRDASGAAVPHASVIVYNSDRKEIAIAGDAGEYEFRSLPEGSYTVETLKRGFAIERKSVVVQANLQERLDITLQLGQVSEAVEVVGRSYRPAPTAGPPTRIRVGGDVQATRLIYAPKPVYPERAEQDGIQGTVLLRAVISVDGSLLGLQPVNSLVDPMLVTAAMDAVKQWRYQPTLLNGQPVEVATNITVSFRLAP